MRLIEQRGGFLYAHRPDVIPHGFVTDEEVSFWCAYYELKDAEGKRRG